MPGCLPMVATGIGLPGDLPGTMVTWRSYVYTCTCAIVWYCVFVYIVESMALLIVVTALREMEVLVAKFKHLSLFVSCEG